jgi:hypothetical protein
LRVVLAWDQPAEEGEQRSDVKHGLVRVRLDDAPAGTLGAILFHEHSRLSLWQPVVVDLSDFAGRRIWLQLVVPPGRGADRVLWVEPAVHDRPRASAEVESRAPEVR